MKIRKSKITLLTESLIPPENDDSSRLMDRFLKSYKQLITDGENIAPTEAFPALFDFVVSAEYARLMAADAGWIYCKGSNSEKPSLFFPYLKTCPRCSVRKGIKSKANSNKPSSSHIGNISSNITFLILSKILQYTRPTAQIFKSTNLQGDVDLVIKDNNLIALIEVKSSPLVVYPMHIQRSYLMTVVIDGEHKLLDDHTSVSAEIRKESINLYIPQKHTTIPMGNYDDGRWPYPQLIRYVSQ